MKCGGGLVRDVDFALRGSRIGLFIIVKSDDLRYVSTCLTMIAVVVNVRAIGVAIALTFARWKM